ncbi:MAG: S-layer homology domain-containing protein [Candidatus Marinimicrobia bacterium]|nr:S-layer homology domain-containing protein [Candidatus Neomarinimicrobiota bacterium]
MRIRMILPLSLVFSLALIGCAPQATSQSDLDTPEYHYRLGVRNLDSGDYQTASGAFRRSVNLDRKFALGWSGLGLAQASLGNFEEGERSVDKGVSLDGKDPLTHVYRARFWIVNRGARGWFDKAEKSLEKSLKLDPGNEAAEFYLGEANFFAMDFDQAARQFGKVVALNGDYSERADKRWAVAQKVVRARPGTDAGRKIALKSEISRADLAVLFAEELKLTKIVERTAAPAGPAVFQAPGAVAAAGQTAVPADVAGSWAETWIMEVLKLGVFEVDPSGNFAPGAMVTRVDYAMAVLRILAIATKDSGLDTRYLGESPSRFSDVPSSHFAYSAMALCAERGIMKADLMTGRFNPAEPVGGADALLIIREIQNSLRITF